MSENSFRVGSQPQFSPQSYPAFKAKEEQGGGGSGLTIPAAIGGAVIGGGATYLTKLGQKDSTVNSLGELTQDTFGKIKEADLSDEAKKAHADLKAYLDEKAKAPAADTPATPAADGTPKVEAPTVPTANTVDETAKDLAELETKGKQTATIKKTHESLRNYIQGLTQTETKLQGRTLSDTPRKLTSEQKTSLDKLAKEKVEKQNIATSRSNAFSEADKKAANDRIAAIEKEETKINQLSKSTQAIENTRIEDLVKAVEARKTTAASELDKAKEALANAEAAVTEAAPNTAKIAELRQDVEIKQIISDAHSRFAGAAASTNRLQSLEAQLLHQDGFLSNADNELKGISAMVQGITHPTAELTAAREFETGSKSIYKSFLDGASVPDSVANLPAGEKPKITQALEEAFTKIKPFLKETSGWKVAGGALAGAVVLGGLAYIFRGNKSQEG